MLGVLAPSRQSSLAGILDRLVLLKFWMNFCFCGCSDQLASLACLLCLRTRCYPHLVQENVPKANCAFSVVRSLLFTGFQIKLYSHVSAQKIIVE